MPLTLKFRLAYEVTDVKVVNETMQVGITTSMFFGDAEIADLALSFLSQALEHQRERASNSFRAIRKYLIGVLRVEVKPSGRRVAASDFEVVELTIRAERESAHPRTWSAADFVYSSRRPKVAAIFQTWAATPASTINVEPKRSVMPRSFYLGHRRGISGHILPPDDFKSDG